MTSSGPGKGEGEAKDIGEEETPGCAVTTCGMCPDARVLEFYSNSDFTRRISWVIENGFRSNATLLIPFGCEFAFIFHSGLPEIRIILQLGICPRIATARVIPSISGIVTSVMRMFGCPSVALSSAERASKNVSTSKSAVRSTSLNNMAICCSSSTTNIFRFISSQTRNRLKHHLHLRQKLTCNELKGLGRW